jgi:hypothetical protein
VAAQNTIPYVLTGGLGHFTVAGDVKFLLTDGFLASDDGGFTGRSGITARSAITEREVKTARLGREPVLTGSETLSDLDTAEPVGLSVHYPNATYTVTFGTVVVLLGDPEEVTPSATSKTTAGFTITLDQAPGLGTSVSVPWEVSP